MNKVLVNAVMVGVLGALLSGCATSMTHQVSYPAADSLFVTMGDDPGTESETSYIPKGTFIHVESDDFVPIPILGMFVKAGESEPQYVFDNIIIPKVKAMGGDALTCAQIQYTPPGSVFPGLFGMRRGGVLVVTGQAVKR